MQDDSLEQDLHIIDDCTAGFATRDAGSTSEFKYLKSKPLQRMFGKRKDMPDDSSEGEVKVVDRCADCNRCAGVKKTLGTRLQSIASDCGDIVRPVLTEAAEQLGRIAPITL